MINQVFWSLVNDPAQGGVDGAAYKDPTFVTPLRLSAACERTREFLLGTEHVLDKAAALSELMRARRYMTYVQYLDRRWVWPVCRSYKPTLAPAFLPELRDRIETIGMTLLNDMIPLVGVFGRWTAWYDLCRRAFTTGVQPFDKIAMLVAIYCHRSAFSE